MNETELYAIDTIYSLIFYFTTKACVQNVM